MYSEETVSFMIVITSPKLFIERILVLKSSHCQLKKELKEWFSIKSHHTMVTELQKTVLEVFILYNLNHQKKIWQNFSPMISMFFVMKLEWSHKIAIKMIVSSSFLSFVVMIQFKFIKMLIKIQVFGEESLCKEKSITLTTDTWLILISKSVGLLN